MKKIAIIRAELAKDINASAKIVATAANSQPQYVNMIRRKIKADLLSPSVKKAPKLNKRVRKMDYANNAGKGIASLQPFTQAIPERRDSLRKSEEIKYYLIIAAIVVVTACLIYAANR